MAIAEFLFFSFWLAVAYGVECNCSLSEQRERHPEDYWQREGRRSVEDRILTECPNGFVRLDDSCYIAAHALANWPEALIYCEAYGAHLAVIESAREQQVLSGYIHNLKGSSTDSHFYYWLGATDAVVENKWIWAKSVKPVTYTHWKPGEPNNDNNHDSMHQDCMAMYGDTGLWDDGACDTKHNFICEINLGVETSEIIG